MLRDAEKADAPAVTAARKWLGRLRRDLSLDLTAYSDSRTASYVEDWYPRADNPLKHARRIWAEQRVVHDQRPHAMDCLVGPPKSKNTAVQTSFVAFFARADVKVAITAAVRDRAAQIRATHDFKALDALRLAAAAEHGVNVFLTADARLASFTALAVEVPR